MERKENSKIFKRKDNFYTPNGFAMENNDLKDWAVYSRIEDSVIRIHAFFKNNSSIGYTFVTNPDIEIPMDKLQNNMYNIFSEITSEKSKEKCYKHIWRPQR